MNKFGLIFLLFFAVHMPNLHSQVFQPNKSSYLLYDNRNIKIIFLPSGQVMKYEYAPVGLVTCYGHKKGRCYVRASSLTTNSPKEVDHLFEKIEDAVVFMDRMETNLKFNYERNVLRAMIYDGWTQQLKLIENGETKLSWRYHSPSDWFMEYFNISGRDLPDIEGIFTQLLKIKDNSRWTYWDATEVKSRLPILFDSISIIKTTYEFQKKGWVWCKWRWMKRVEYSFVKKEKISLDKEKQAAFRDYLKDHIQFNPLKRKRKIEQHLKVKYWVGFYFEGRIIRKVLHDGEFLRMEHYEWYRHPESFEAFLN